MHGLVLRGYRDFRVAGLLMALTVGSVSGQPPSSAGLTAGAGGVDGWTTNAATITITGTSGDQNCECGDLQATVQFNPIDGSISFSVSPYGGGTINPSGESISHDSSTTANPGGSGQPNQTIAHGTTSVSVSTTSSGAEGKVRGLSSMQLAMDGHVQALQDSGHAAAFGVSATQTITISFQHTPEGCEEPCDYDLSITVTYSVGSNGTLSATGATASD